MSRDFLPFAARVKTVNLKVSIKPTGTQIDGTGKFTSNCIQIKPCKQTFFEMVHCGLVSVIKEVIDYGVVLKVSENVQQGQLLCNF